MEAEDAALAAQQLQRGAKLGAGAFGTVYAARDLATGESVALKFLPVSTSDIERLTTEVGVLSHLSHAHIVCMRKVVRLPAHLVVVMPRALGGDLRALLERAPGGALGEDAARRVLQQLARGLRYAHSKKVIHRDLKLENVLVREAPGAAGAEGEHVLIADFGLSAMGHSRTTDALLSRSGSLYYMVRWEEGRGSWQGKVCAGQGTRQGNLAQAPWNLHPQPPPAAPAPLPLPLTLTPRTRAVP